MTLYIKKIKKNSMLRQLFGIENSFANPYYSSFVQFSIRVNDQSKINQIVNNFKKIFLGLNLKVENYHYSKASQESINNNIIKQPMWIQDCKEACHWMDQFCTAPITERLTTIATNDHIIAINSNHIVADSSFIVNAIDHALDDNILQSNPNLQDELTPIQDSVAFKSEIERAERNKPSIHPNASFTSFQFDVNDQHLVKKSPIQIHFDDEIPFENLTCYDKKLKKPKQMNELLWTEITMNLNAMSLNLEGNKYQNQPLCLPIIVDTRKLADDQLKINWRNANCISTVNLLVNPEDGMTLVDIFNLFRKDLNENLKDKAFYWINNGDFKCKSGRATGRNSSVGTIKLNKPIVDFFIQSSVKISKDLVFNNIDGIGFNLFSFSKISKTKNVFCPTVYFDNSISLMKETLVLTKAFKHFITKIPVDTRYKDALNEIQHFQKVLLDN